MAQAPSLFFPTAIAWHLLLPLSYFTPGWHALTLLWPSTALLLSKLLFFLFKHFNSNKNMITVYRMQIQNNMEVCCVKLSYIKGLTTILRKMCKYGKKTVFFNGIFSDFGLTLLFEFLCSSVYFILVKLRPGIFFLLHSVLEIGSHAAQGGLFPNESKEAECVANITRRWGKFWVLGQLGIHNWTMCLKNRL